MQSKITDVAILSRVGVLRLLTARGIPRLTPGFVLGLINHHAARIRDEAGRTKMVTDDEGQCSIFSHGNSLTSSIIVFGHFCTCDFIVIPNKISSGANEVRGQHRFYSFFVTIIGEGCI